MGRRSTQHAARTCDHERLDAEGGSEDTHAIAPTMHIGGRPVIAFAEPLVERGHPPLRIERLTSRCASLPGRQLEQIRRRCEGPQVGLGLVALLRVDDASASLAHPR